MAWKTRSFPNRKACLPMRRDVWIATACLSGVVACIFHLWPEHGKETDPPTSSPPNVARPKRQRDAFWQEARIRESSRYREPSALASPVVTAASADHQTRIEELLSKGDPNGVTVELVDWFSTDPASARDWLATKDSLGFCQPALKMVAVSFASRGDCDLALEWTELLDSPAVRDEAVARIYSTGYTIGRFSSEDLAAAPLTEESRRAILNGSAND